MYNYQMYKAEQIKTRKQSMKEIKRFQSKHSKNTEKHTHQATSSNYLINIKTEKPRKCSDKIITEREKVHKQKKIRYITEDIEKSTQDLLSVGTKSLHKDRSIKLSTHNVEEENAYQICRSIKKSRHLENKQEGKGSETNKYKNNLNTGKIRIRKEKSHSKDINLKFETLKPRNISSKKTNRASNSNLKSEKRLKTRQFLSPQIVQQQNSYYFANCDQQEGKLGQNNKGVPKKESKYIFQSNKSIWKEHHKKITHSTVDLLN